MKTGGSIYAIGIVGTRQVKIGLTREAVEERLRALQAEHPAPLTLLGSVRVRKQFDRIKKPVHGFLAWHRLSGEWFDVDMDARRLVDLVTRAQRVLTAQRTSREQRRVARVSRPPGATALPESPVNGAHGPRPEARFVPPAQGGCRRLTRPVEDCIP